MASLPLVLASASPRRLELLRRLGLAPACLPQRIDEAEREGESPRDLVVRLAEAKSDAAAAAFDRGPAVVLGADTVVAVDGRKLGKPHDAVDAASMLRRLRGRTHEVWSGVCLLRTDDGRRMSDAECTRVRFRNFDDETLDWYVRSGEPMDKAGAYALQGCGVLLSAGIEGSWSNVVGLPLEPLPRWLARLGLDWRELAAQPPINS